MLRPLSLCVVLIILHFFVSLTEASPFPVNVHTTSTPQIFLSKNLFNQLTTDDIKKPYENPLYFSQNVNKDDFILRIEELTISPQSVVPGSSVKMSASYFISSLEKQNVILTEVRRLEYFDKISNNWKELGTVQNKTETGNGTKKIEGTIDIPRELIGGFYKIVLILSVFNKQDSKEAIFEVKGIDKKLTK